MISEVSCRLNPDFHGLGHENRPGWVCRFVAWKPILTVVNADNPARCVTPGWRLPRRWEAQRLIRSAGRLHFGVYSGQELTGQKGC
jgi:hypothetical protein